VRDRRRGRSVMSRPASAAGRRVAGRRASNNGRQNVLG
jgi:hypothetical protein